MRLTWSIDWLNFTAHIGTSVLLHPTAYPIAHPRPVRATPVHGYTSARMNRLGARWMWANERAEMGCHIMYSGRALKLYAREGIDALAILRRHLSFGDICKRLDLAIDVHDGGLKFSELRACLERDRATTRAKTYNSVTGTSGETLYIGSRISDQFLRIYDKAAEQHIDGNWKRIELELKGSRALQMARELAIQDTAYAQERTRTMIKAFIDFPLPSWKDIIGNTAIGMGKAQDNLPDTKQWLITQCAPAMARYIHETGDEMIIADFLDVVDVTTRSLTINSDKIDNYQK